MGRVDTDVFGSGGGGGGSGGAVALLDFTTDTQNTGGGGITFADADLDPIADGSVLIGVVNAASAGISWPAGFQVVQSNSTYSGSRGWEVAYKVASSESGDYSVSHSGKAVGVLMVFSNLATRSRVWLEEALNASLSGSDLSWTPSPTIFGEAGDLIIEVLVGSSGIGDGNTVLSFDVTEVAQLVSSASSAVGLAVGYDILGSAVADYLPDPSDVDAPTGVGGGLIGFRQAV